MSGHPQRDHDVHVANILPPGLAAGGASATKVYALTASSVAKALATEFSGGFLGKWITLKANRGTVYFSFGTGTDAVVDADGAWCVHDGETQHYFIEAGSAITTLEIIASDTVPKLYVYVSSPIVAEDA